MISEVAESSIRSSKDLSGMKRLEAEWERRLQSDLVTLLPRLRRFAYGLCGSTDEGDDLVQAACERALGRLHQFRPGTRLDSWMYRIIQTQWLDRVRQKRLSPEVPMEGGEAYRHIDGETTIEAKLTLDSVRREIARLPEDQRVVLLLVCGEGLTYKDAAETLNIPIGTVMSRLARARMSLTTLLAEPETDR
jgi:RNA polymerase sigma-70 factor (ECF subfamily)